MPPRTRRAEQSEATRAALLKAARTLFGKRGYTGVSTEAIVARARVTRGALYHHFDDKRDLFRAVVEEVEQEIAHRIAEGALAHEDPLEALYAGCRMFLDMCGEQEVQQIVLTDAPAALGWQAWREIEERYGYALVRMGLERAMDEGVLAQRPLDPVARLVMGAMTEAGLMLVDADDPARTRDEAERALFDIVEAFRAA